MDTIFLNYFAPGHGKGICESEGGINKNATASAALCGVALTLPWKVYQYLSQHRVDAISKTAHALFTAQMSANFDEGVFLHHICLALFCMHAVFKF